MTTFHLLRLTNFPIFQQLQLEEALLRADDRNWCLINDGSCPSIVMGISGKPEILINKSLIKKQPVPVIRRFSGGGTVFVDEDTLFITLICNSGSVQVPCISDKILRWTEKLYQPAFSVMNFQLKENDYAIDDRKFGGNAYYLRKDRFLHHSSLLWDFDSQRMNYLLMPPKIPDYRQLRSHDDFLCRLNKYYPGKQILRNQLIDCLSKGFKVVEMGLESIQDIMGRPYRKATSYVDIA